MNDPAISRRELAEAIRDACVAAARAGYEDAATAGLCHEGAWEAALGATQRLDLPALLAAAPPGAGAAAASKGAPAADK